MSKARYLLDVNVLIALTDELHAHHRLVNDWIKTPGLQWGVCAFTEAGFLRVTTNPRAGAFTLETAGAILADLPNRPGYQYWAIAMGWSALAAPFSERIFGHQQITDAFLLGLAVREGGVLVTMDKAVRSMAGARCSQHVLVLE